MSSQVLEISPVGLALAFLPVVAVVGVLLRWSLGPGRVGYALARMLLQLLAIGYVLNFLFSADQSWIVAAVLAVMLVAASWIALRPVNVLSPGSYARALFSIAAASLPVLLLVTQFVIGVEPWFSPQYVIPLGGMIFAGSMNAVSLAAERQQAELAAGRDELAACGAGLNAALIPLINSLLAVGLVSLPGMMTGQVLSGIDPLVAARYQIVVMCMLFGASGLSAACYVWLTTRR
jgi:putative ABC transport system permease protein